MERLRSTRPSHSDTTDPDIDPKLPPVAPDKAWQWARSHYRLVSPANRKKFRIIVVGTGLAGSGAATTLAQLGYSVDVFTFHDSPRRAHSVAAQGGINAVKGHPVDSDTLHRFVIDTVKGGDFRAREADVWRLAEESAHVIDYMNALGVPFAREYGGNLTTRSFGGVQVSRTYYSRGQTGQQLQIAAASALQRQVAAGSVRLHTRHDMLDLITEDGRAAGIVTRNRITGEVTAHKAHAVIVATGGYGTAYYYSTLAMNCNATAAWRAHKRGAFFAHPSFIQFHPTGLPVTDPWQSKTTLMSESLRNDGRIWVPATAGDDRPPNDIPDDERDYYLERQYPAFGNLTPRDIASRAAKVQIDNGHGVGPLHNSVYLDFRDAIAKVGRDTIEQRYGNLFDMYRDATGEDPYTQPMRIAPSAHFTMGGLWSDYNLQTTIDGLFVAGEAGWAYHGANRLGANSLLSACVDGWLTIPQTVPDYLAGCLGRDLVSDDVCDDAVNNVKRDIDRLIAIGGSTPVRDFHRQLGQLLYEFVGVSREAEKLDVALQAIVDLRKQFYNDLYVDPTPGVNQDLEYALRVRDFLELAQLMCIDAATRDESCGAHFRRDHSADGQAVRDDDNWQGVLAWEYAESVDTRNAPANRQPTEADMVITPKQHFEPLTFTSVTVATRSYT